MTAPWLVLGNTGHRMPSLFRLMSDLIFLLEPPDFNAFLVPTVYAAQKGEMMSEKTTKEKDRKDGPVPRLTTRSTRRNRKEKATEPANTRQEAQTRGKVAETAHSSKLTAFSFEARQARSVYLAGCFNGWDPEATRLKQNEEGIWKCVIGIEPGEHQYRFAVDGEWKNDPLNAGRCWNEFGTENCVLVVEE